MLKDRNRYPSLKCRSRRRRCSSRVRSCHAKTVAPGSACAVGKESPEQAITPAAAALCRRKSRRVLMALLRPVSVPRRELGIKRPEQAAIGLFLRRGLFPLTILAIASETGCIVYASFGAFQGVAMGQTGSDAEILPGRKTEALGIVIFALVTTVGVIILHGWLFGP